MRAYDAWVQQNRATDPITTRLAAFWRAKRHAILAIVDRADQLAHALQQRDAAFVICHADLHARNVLTRGDADVAIVDWDEPILAPKERDLMFIGGAWAASGTTTTKQHGFTRGMARRTSTWPHSAIIAMSGS